MTTQARMSARPWLEFTVPGNPRPWERAGSNGTRRFTPKVTSATEEAVAWEARAAILDVIRNGHRPIFSVPIVAPIAVELDFYRATARRVDLDNLGKAVLDGATGVVWADDSQIERLTLTKRVDRVSPRTVVRVYLAADAA